MTEMGTKSKRTFRLSRYRDLIRRQSARQVISEEGPMPKISSGGRVTIPLQIRAALRLRAGDHVEFVAMEEEFVMVAATPRRTPRVTPRKARLVVSKAARPANGYR